MIRLTRKESINAPQLNLATILEHMLIVMINVVLLNLVEHGERREMSSSKVASGLNSAVLKPNTKDIQLPTNAHKDLSHFHQLHKMQNQFQRAQMINQCHQVTQLLQELIQWEEPHYLTSWVILILI